MGSVAMGIGGSHHFEGYNISEIAHCLYCDKCGSFRIGKRPTLQMLVGIAIAVLITNAVSYSMDKYGAWLA